MSIYIWGEQLENKGFYLQWEEPGRSRVTNGTVQHVMKFMYFNQQLDTIIIRSTIIVFEQLDSCMSRAILVHHQGVYQLVLYQTVTKQYIYLLWAGIAQSVELLPTCWTVR
jgi:hypothetical protein